MAIAGVDRGSGTVGSSTSMGVVPASNFNAGSKAVLVCAYDNAGSGGADPYSSISDTAGNTWTPRINSLNDPGAANAGVAARIFDCDMTVATLTTGDTITVSFGGTTVAVKAWTLMEITPDSGYTVVYVTGGQAAETSGTPSITTGSITSGGLVIGAVGREGNETQTDDGDTTNGNWSAGQKAATGTTTSGVEIISQRKVVTATATQTYNPTYGGTSRDGCNMWAWFTQNKSIVPGGEVAATFTGRAPDLLRGTVVQPDRAQLVFSSPTPKLGAVGGFFSLALLEGGNVGAVEEGNIFISPPGPTALTFTGRAPIALRGTVTQPAQASLTFTGPEPTDVLDTIIGVGRAQLAFTGLAPSLLLGTITQPAQAALVFSGLAPSLLGQNSYLPDTAALAFTGRAPTLAVTLHHVVFPAQGTAAFTGYAPTVVDSFAAGFFSLALLELGGAGVLESTITLPDRAQLAFTGRAPSLLLDTITQPAQAALAFTGLVPALSLNTFYQPAQASLTFTGRQPSLVAAGAAAPENAAAVFTGLAPIALVNHLTQPAQAPLTFTALAPAVLVDQTVTPGVGSAAFTGRTPSLLHDTIVVVPGAAAASFTGRAPTLALSNSFEAKPAQATAAFTGLAPSLLTGQIRVPDAAALTFSGQVPVSGEAFWEFPGIAALSFSGAAPTITVAPPAEVPGTDFSLPVAWYADPGYAALYTFYQAVDFNAGMGVTPEEVRLTFTGHAPLTVEVGRTIIPGIASAVFTGHAPALVFTGHLTVFPAAGTLAFSGHVPAASGTYVCFPGQAVVTWSGHVPVPARGPVTIPGIALLEVVGLLPEVIISDLRVGTPAAATASFIGLEPAIAVNATVTPSVAALTLTPLTPVGVRGLVNESSAAGTAAFTGLAPSLVFSLVAQPDAASLVTTGYATDPLVSLTAHPAQAVVTAEGHAPVSDATGSTVAVPSTVSTVLSGHVATPVQSAIVEPGVAELVISGEAPAFETGTHLVEPSQASAAFTGLAPAIALTGNHLFEPSQAALTLTGEVGEVHVDQAPAADRATLAFTGLAPVLLQTRHHVREPAAAVLTVEALLAFPNRFAIYVYPGCGEMTVTGYDVKLKIRKKTHADTPASRTKRAAQGVRNVRDAEATPRRRPNESPRRRSGG